MQNWYRLLLLCAALACCTAESQAQLPILNPANGDVTPATPPATGEPESSPGVPVPSKRQEVVEHLRVAQRTLDTAKGSSGKNGAQPPVPLQREVELLKQLEGVVAQLEVTKTAHNDQQTRINDLEAELATVRAHGPPEQSPYSFLLFDRLRDELAARQARTESVEAASASAAEAVTRARENLDTKQQALRQAKEAAQSNHKTVERQRELADAAKLAEIEVRIATESLVLKKQELENQQHAHQLHQKQLELLEEKLKWIAKGVEFSQRDLSDQMIEIEKQEEDLRNELRLAESNQQYADSEWARVRQQLDTSMDKSAELVEQVEAKQLSRQLLQTQITLLNTRLQRRGANQEIWQRRYQVIRESADTEDLITWGAEARSRLDQLDQEKRLAQLRIDELRQDLVGFDKEAQAAGEDPGEGRRWIQAQRDATVQVIQLHDKDIVSIEDSRRLTEKLVAEIEGDVTQWTFSEWIASVGHYVGKAWNTELTKVDDRPLTVGKVVVGVLLIFCGFVLARMLSRMFGHRLQGGRIRMNESGAAAIQSLSFYVLLFGFTLTALKFVNVPLTMFTFLGGAIAIGVGFGSQNMLNNFISGLILLAERPIKVGDLIQVDELFGNVERIGARSTVIRTGSNLDIIIPNSTFLENNVVNLTRGDDKLRTHVQVGIAYGSPTREATRLMKHAAVEHGLILNSPEPYVWFTEFGDNSLNFEVHFWVKVRRIADRKRIESDLRYIIDQHFRDAGIVIAFPQRDVHFDASQPIPLRIQMDPPGDGVDKSHLDAA